MDRRGPRPRGRHPRHDRGHGPPHGHTPRRLRTGATALDPVATFRGPARIGAGWLTLPHQGRVITWHNGANGGFRTWLGLDRSAGTGVVLMSATSASADHHGFTLLAQLTSEEGH